MFVKKLYKIILVYKKVNKIILSLIKEEDCWYKNINYLENQAGFSSASGQSAVNRTGDGNMRIPAGTFEYHCTPHPYMTGTVIVEE